jgi:hypothetical protein
MSVKKDLGTIEGHLEPINHTANGIGFDPTGTGLASDNVQDAIAELATGASGPQAFVGQKEITTAVVLPPKTYLIATGLVITATGSISIGQDSDLLLI